MTKYNVHVYTVVRVKCLDIEAEDMPGAIQKAVEGVNFDNIFNRYGYHLSSVQVEYTAWADEHQAFLVDVVGDEEYKLSQVFKASEVEEAP